MSDSHDPTPYPLPKPCEALRETFLAQCHHLEHRETIRRFGDLLAELLLDADHVTRPDPKAEPDQSPTERDLAAVLVDLRKVQADLADVGRQYRASNLDREDTIFSLLAEEKALDVGAVADAIQAKLEQAI